MVITTVLALLSVFSLVGAYFLGEAHVAFLVREVHTALDSIQTVIHD